MQKEMDYLNDRDWYDCEEGGTNSSSCFLGSERWKPDELCTEHRERKVILLVHDTKPPFLDEGIVFTKQAEPIMPIKDPKSNMAIISRKGSNLVRAIDEKQQRFWELAGSKLCEILGVEKTAEQVGVIAAVENRA